MNERVATYWGQFATAADPLEQQSGYGTYDFYAYDTYGNLVIATWTSAPVTFQVERDAYQSRLNDRQDSVVRVEVTRRIGSAPSHIALARTPGKWTMSPQVSQRSKPL